MCATDFFLNFFPSLIYVHNELIAILYLWGEIIDLFRQLSDRFFKFVELIHGELFERGHIWVHISLRNKYGFKFIIEFE